MPWGIAAGVAGSVAGGLINNAMSPGTSGGGPNYYTPTGLGAADTNWQSLLGQENSALGNSLGVNSSYGVPYQNAADRAGAQYGWLANLMQGQANSNFGTQGNLLNAGQQVWNMGLDPQNALYNRTLQQVTDKTNATNSMYGLGSSAAGAGMANQAISNFNIDWQNNQLGRALQGLQGYTGAANEAGRYGQLGGEQAGMVPGYTLASGSTPYQTATGIASYPLTLESGIMSQIIPYMNYGSGAQAVPFQAGINNANQWGGAVGSAVTNGLNGLFNSGGGGTSGIFGGSNSGIWNSGGDWMGGSGYSGGAPLSYGF